MATYKQKQRVLELAFIKCNNQNGNDVSIDNILMSYKTIEELADQNEIDAMYDYIAERMGLGKNFTEAQEKLLINNGWLENTEIEEQEVKTENRTQICNDKKGLKPLCSIIKELIKNGYSEVYGYTGRYGMIINELSNFENKSNLSYITKKMYIKVNWNGDGKTFDTLGQAY